MLKRQKVLYGIYIMTYKRVIPRDLFNEAKLLKCLGQLQLLIHDGNLKFTSDFDNEAFEICQNPLDGSLYCSNYNVYLDNEHIPLFTNYNSRENYPLFAIYKDEAYYLFDEQGRYMPNWGRK